MNEILNISNVHGYMDKQTGAAYLNAEDVARGFGFTQEKNGVEYVRWETVNGYLRGFGFSQHVGKDSFLPENMVYRLGFKASNEVAQKFQAVLADEVLPAIRRHGGAGMKYHTIYADPPWMERGGRQDQAGSGSPLPAHEYKRHHGARRPQHCGG